MAQVFFTAGADISSIHKRAEEAESLASLARAKTSGRAFNARVQGGQVANDRVLVAASAGFQAEIQGFTAAGRAVSHAASLLQAADSGLAAISVLLDEITDLAETVGDFADLEIDNAEFSSLDGIKLDVQFDRIKAEIDEIASDTSFEGTQLLAGDGSGGDYEITYRVGTGTDSTADEITVSISAADVSSLSSALASDDFYDQTNAETVYDDAEEAKIALNSIRNAIDGNQERFAAAELNASGFSASYETARSALADPFVAIDFSQLGADQLSNEANLHLVKGAAEQFQSLINRIDLTSMTSQDGDQAAAAKTGPDTASGPLTAPSAADRVKADSAIKRGAEVTTSRAPAKSSPDTRSDTDITV